MENKDSPETKGSRRNFAVSLALVLAVIAGVIAAIISGGDASAIVTVAGFTFFGAMIAAIFYS